MSFGENYKKITETIKDDLTKLEEELKSVIDLYPQLDEEIAAFLTCKSKRIRPLTAFLYLRASGFEPVREHYTLLSAVEIIHNASLLHDDVIDESGTRRGNVTVNEKFGSKIAILSGDYLLASALDRLNSLNKPQITALCANTVREMCQGEVFQIFNRGKIPTLEQYLKKTAQKTAGLFVTAIKGSMLLAGKKDTTAAEEFALNFGMAFQIRDDLLNVLNYDTLKPSQNDIQSGIYTAPVIFAGSTTNLNGGIEKTKDLLNNYVIKTRNTAENLENNRFKTTLNELLEILNNA